MMFFFILMYLFINLLFGIVFFYLILLGVCYNVIVVVVNKIGEGIRKFKIVYMREIGILYLCWVI